jgi:hypothetical protein
MDTRDLGVLMFCLLAGLPFCLGFFLGWKAARFNLPGLPAIRWPWSRYE